MIQEKISGGRARITGSFTTEEANDLAIALGKARIKQARETGSSVIVSACHWCEQNLRDSSRHSDGLRILDVVDSIAENL